MNITIIKLVVMVSPLVISPMYGLYPLDEGDLVRIEYFYFTMKIVIVKSAYTPQVQSNYDLSWIDSRGPHFLHVPSWDVQVGCVFADMVRHVFSRILYNIQLFLIFLVIVVILYAHMFHTLHTTVFLRERKKN